MELTQDEKQRIYLEEKTRLEARQELEKPTKEANAKQLGIIFAFLIVMWFFWQYILIPYIIPMLQEMGL